MHREMSNFEYLMHLNTCLSSSTLVAIADGRNLRADKLTLDMQLYAPTGDAIRIKSIQTASSPFMIRIVTDRGQHEVTPNHLVTLRFAPNPSVHMELLPTAHCVVVQWWDKRDLQMHQHRFPCVELPECLAGREREFAAWWLERAEQAGREFPLRRGELLDVRADTLLTMLADEDPFIKHVAIPMARLAHQRVASSTTEGAATTNRAVTAAAQSVAMMPAAVSVAAKDGDLAALAASFLLEAPASALAASDVDAGADADSTKVAVTVTSADVVQQILDLHTAGDKIGNISMQLGVSRVRVMAVIEEAGLDQKGATWAANILPKAAAAQMHVATSTLDSKVAYQQSMITPLKRPDGVYVYEPCVGAAAGHKADVLCMLLNQHGQKALTLMQLERAWDTLDIDLSQSGVVVTELNPVCSATAETDSCPADFDAICADAMSAVILTADPPPSTVVVFGHYSSGGRCASTGFVHSVPGVAHVAPMRRHCDSDAWSREMTTTRGATIRVVFAPHPSAVWLFSDVLAALCLAHHLPFTSDLLDANPVAHIRRMERVGADKYVAIEVDSADQRFVLSDLSITHNCSGRSYNDINQYPVFPWIIAHYPEPKVKLVAGGSGSGSSGASAQRGVEVPDEGVDNIDVEEVIRAGPSHKHTARVFRDLSKPMGAIDDARLAQVLERFSSFFDSTIPPFHYVRTHTVILRSCWAGREIGTSSHSCVQQNIGVLLVSC